MQLDKLCAANLYHTLIFCSKIGIEINIFIFSTNFYTDIFEKSSDFKVSTLDANLRILISRENDQDIAEFKSRLIYHFISG